MAEAAKDGSQGVFAAVASDLPGAEEKVAEEASVKPPDPDTRDAKISPIWRQRFQDFFVKYSETLRKALPEASKLRRTTEDMTRITRKADAEGGAPCRRPYRMSVEELRQLRERVEQLMEKGYIRPSCSPYAAPCLMELQNSPSQYQRRMQRALGHLPVVRIFIDDVVVFTKGDDIEAHHNHVKHYVSGDLSGSWGVP
ncbi:hypothetical protein CYMTET_50501 [Cymbomonas tetramitiformis]|uniref:Reverse transcriptase n=1 Tax=Cymbomonas tetramitiformis TaxID=36881 RepID=A0AAE0BMZ6_9CHLO|nr:hypothetical protein CYMTET_50501 [Cymbomonas tetramitiformis]